MVFVIFYIAFSICLYDPFWGVNPYILSNEYTKSLEENRSTVMGANARSIYLQRSMSELNERTSESAEKASYFGFLRSLLRYN